LPTGTYTDPAEFSLRRIGPRMSAEARAPMRMEICCAFGVAPTRNPVFRSCEVVPPFDAAMQTMPPMESAVTKKGGPVQPTTRKTKQVRSNVATVMPEIGLEDDPISPVSREETVTNRKPNATI